VIAPSAPDRTCPLDIDIAVEAEGWAAFDDLEALIGRAVVAGLAVSSLQPMTGAELSILLTDNARMRKINQAWRAKDKPTNVLSFPAVSPERIATSPLLGDIALALETVQREAQDDGKTFEAHLSHLVIHGLLHLLGGDHETDAQAEEMEAREVAALARLGYADPYEDGEHDDAAA
jgi:probable rRNA maturation factor